MLPITNIHWREYKTWRDPFPIGIDKFCSINFFYGSNGSGKSSLTTLIFETYQTTQGPDPDKIKVFDSSFIDKALKISDSDDKIHGAVSSFGEDNVQVDNDLMDKNIELQKILNDIELKTTEIDDAEEELKKRVLEVYNDKRGAASIKQKPQNKTAIEQIDLWKEDYTTARKKFPEVELGKYCGDGASNDELEDLQSLDIPSLPNIDTNEIYLILKQPYDDNLIPKKSIVDWIADGIKYHQEHGEKQCLFCGNSELDLHLVEEQLKEYQDNEKNEKAKILDDLNKNIEKYVDAVDIVLENTRLCKKLVTDLDEGALGQFKIIFEESSRIINEKIDNMAGNFKLNKEELDNALQILEKTFKQIQNKKMARIKDLGAQIANIETLTKGAIGLILSNDSLVTTIKENHASAVNSLQALIKRKQVLNTEIARLKRSKSKLANFATFVNDVLSTLDMRFYLEPDDEEKDFYIKHKDAHDGQISVNDISEGERNMLALIYFIYNLLDEKELIKNEIDIIIMDDPISSLDDNNKFAIIQLITELVEKTKNSKNKQIFILTHSISDFINLTYNYKDDKNITKLYRVYKADHRSSLKPISKKILSPYQLLYEDVFLFSNLSESDLMNKPDEEAIHIPNSIRRLLEDYCGFRIGIKDINIRHKTDVAKALFGKENTELSGKENRNMENILRICNVLSHKANSHPHDIKEVWRASKDLMSIIKQYDKYHHLKMIENVQNS